MKTSKQCNWLLRGLAGCERRTAEQVGNLTGRAAEKRGQRRQVRSSRWAIIWQNRADGWEDGQREQVSGKWLTRAGGRQSQSSHSPNPLHNVQIKKTVTPPIKSPESKTPRQATISRVRAEQKRLQTRGPEVAVSVLKPEKQNLSYRGQWGGKQKGRSGRQSPKSVKAGKQGWSASYKQGQTIWQRS